MGHDRFGYRASSCALHDVVLDLFPGSTAGGSAQPNLSVIIGEATGAVRTKNVLYVNNVMVLATSSFGRLVRSMVHGLEHILATADSDHLEVRGTALKRGRSTVLIDNSFGSGMRDEAARLRGSGWQLWDAPAALLQLSSGRIVEPPPVDCVDRDFLASMSADDPCGPTELAGLGAVEASDIIWIVPESMRDSPASHLLGLMRSRTTGRCDGAAERLSALETLVGAGQKRFCAPRNGRELIEEVTSFIG